MGMLKKLAAKVEKALDGTTASSGGSQQQQQQQQQHQPYAPPVIMAPAPVGPGYYTPPPSPPPYAANMYAAPPQRPMTPPAGVQASSVYPQQGAAFAAPAAAFAAPAAAFAAPAAAAAAVPDAAGGSQRDQYEQQARETAPEAAGSYLAPTTYSPNPQGPQRGRKKALLIGCTYPNTSATLRGTMNDVLCMQHVLVTRFGFSDRNMLVLRDDVRQQGFVSDRATIFAGIHWLISDMQPGDSLFFHFSGHGSRKRDPLGEEEDGYDETILPTDFKTAGQIRDTELNRQMVAWIPRGVTLHAVFDSCHSGTMLDLPFETRFDKQGRADWRHVARMKGTSGGLAVQIGACSDDQTAADTAALSQTAYTGAATYTFIDSIEKYGTQQTYGNLLLHMTQSLRALGKTSVKPASTGAQAAGAALPFAMAIALGPIGLLGGMVAGNAIASGRLSSQKPTLCCNEPIDLGRVVLQI